MLTTCSLARVSPAAQNHTTQRASRRSPRRSRKLVTYEGGHGWHGDVFGHIRKGIEWMQE